MKRKKIGEENERHKIWSNLWRSHSHSHWKSFAFVCSIVVVASIHSQFSFYGCLELTLSGRFCFRCIHKQNLVFRRCRKHMLGICQRRPVRLPAYHHTGIKYWTISNWSEMAWVFGHMPHTTHNLEIVIIIIIVVGKDFFGRNCLSPSSSWTFFYSFFSFLPSFGCRDAIVADTQLTRSQQIYFIIINIVNKIPSVWMCVHFINSRNIFFLFCINWPKRKREAKQ